MIDFIQNLFEDGEIVVPRAVTCSPESVERLLIFSERIWRKQWPGKAPTFRPDVAAKAAAVLCSLCQATVYRELDENTIAAQLDSTELAIEDSAEAWYSADLALRFLPQVYERLSRITNDDPVLELVVKVGRAWPLSSVGIADCGPDEMQSAFDDSGIFRMYVDRVMACSDQERLKLPRVADAVNSAIGPFESLRSKSGLTLAVSNTD